MGKIQVITIGCVIAALAFTGCHPDRKDMQGVTEYQELSNGYMSYKIENGTVKCREHRSRSELACWKIEKDNRNDKDNFAYSGNYTISGS